MSGALTVVLESVATEKYQLKKQLSSLFDGWHYENRLKNHLFLVVEGDLKLNQDLRLDLEANTWTTDALAWRKSLGIVDDRYMPENYGIRGLIVTGDLVVDGSIINRDSESGAFMLVMGNVHAHSLVSGGAYMQVNGNATIRDVAYGHYNDGCIFINGDLSAPVFISEDHGFSYKSLSNNQFRYNSHEDSLQEDDEEGNPLIPETLRPLLSNEIEAWGDILGYLCAGYPVLASHDAHAFKKDAAYWERRIRSNWSYIEKVPEADLTAELCVTAIEQNWGTLSKIPDAHKTSELCTLAVTKNGHALNYAPKKLITRELCELAFKTYFSLLFTPQEFISLEMALKVVEYEPKETQYLSKEMANEVRKLLKAKS